MKQYDAIIIGFGKGGKTLAAELSNRGWKVALIMNCPVVETSALKQTGLDKLIDKAVEVARKKEADLPKEIFSEELEKAVAAVAEVLPESISADKKRWYAVKFLENDSKVVESVALPASAAGVVESARKELEEKHDDDMESIVTDERYQYIQKVVSDTVQKGREKLTVSDKIDRIVTNRFLGLPIFVFVMCS